MTEDRRLVRLFPVPFRLVEDDQQFKKWQWVSSGKALKNGAYFKTRGRVVAVPDGTLTADQLKASSRLGERLPLKTWFENAHPDAVVREMKLHCDNYGYTLSLLHLGTSDKVWAPRDWSQGA
jgi:hypothetical protein